MAGATLRDRPRSFMPGACERRSPTIHAKIAYNRRALDIEYTVQIWKEDSQFVAHAMPIDVMQGKHQQRQE
ncbi:MAG: hypothetical protein EBE86_028485 [Hormoscilla sp. GUM202]|nr:hypothetical protein [Hormoscilla sp. GUM202]